MIRRVRSWMCVSVLVCAAAGVAPDVWRVAGAPAAALAASGGAWFTELPPPGTPVRAIPASPPAATAADGVSTVLISSEGDTPAQICVLNNQGGAESPFFPYGTSFRGGVRVAAGDVNGDGVLDIVAAPASPLPNLPLRLFQRPGAQSFVGEGFVFSQPFAGGVNVAVGDVNGDGVPDIIAAAGAGGPPLVRVFSLAGGARLLDEFLAFESGFTGGVRVAAGDINDDGAAEIVTARAAGAPEVRLFSSRSGGAREVGRGFAFDPGGTGGITVAAGDVNGDGIVDIIVGAGGGAPQVRVFTLPRVGGVVVIGDVLAYETAFTGGVRVAAGDVTGDGRDDLIVTPGPGRLTHPRAWDFQPTPAPVPAFLVAPPLFGGSYDRGVWVAGGRTRF
jgi:hypothetical protein